MATIDSSLRRRKPEPKQPKHEREQEEYEKAMRKEGRKPVRKTTAKDRLANDDTYSLGTLILDIFRVLTFLFLASCGLSYLISSGETFFWGMSNPPKYVKLHWWKKQFTPPLYLTPTELTIYNGSDPSLPIYLAINWTIYDVSSNRRTYGPGGSYHHFAGCDAARAFVTGCFAEDRTPDMRGVEEMFLPLDDPAVDRHWTGEELKEMRMREREEAEKKVREGLLHWVNFFEKNPKYERVGYVKMPEGWPGTEPRRGLCEAAKKGRRVRTVPGKEGGN